MRKVGNDKLFGFASVLATLCVAALLVVQIAISFGHDEQSHHEGLDQVCDYCVVKQSLADLDLGEAPAETPLFRRDYRFLNAAADLTHLAAFTPWHSRAPPQVQNT